MKRQALTYGTRRVGRYGEIPKPCICRWTPVSDGFLLTRVCGTCVVHKHKAGLWREISTVAAGRSVL
jgi:hypothetical protein